MKTSYDITGVEMGSQYIWTGLDTKVQGDSHLVHEQSNHYGPAQATILLSNSQNFRKFNVE